MPRPNYRFCTQPVTLYLPLHTQGFTLLRWVLPRCLLQAQASWQSASAYAKSGLRGNTSNEQFLLIIPLTAAGCAMGTALSYLPMQQITATGPADAFTLGKGMKVYRGEGPLITTQAEFAALVPATDSRVYLLGSLCEVYGENGTLLHIECGA